MTSLNLFATQFDNVVRLCEAKKDVCEFIVVDTPGQIEVFTWSASGSIITDSLAVTFPTCVLLDMFLWLKTMAHTIQLGMSWTQRDVLLLPRSCRTCSMRAPFFTRLVESGKIFSSF